MKVTVVLLLVVASITAQGQRPQKSLLEKFPHGKALNRKSLYGKALHGKVLNGKSLHEKALNGKSFFNRLFARKPTRASKLNSGGVALQKQDIKYDALYDTGTCVVPIGWIGDDWSDCCDSSDEHVGHPDCLHGWYCKNYNNDDYCIPFEWENDLEVDCHDASDENIHMCQERMMPVEPMPEVPMSMSLVEEASLPFRLNREKIQRGLFEWLVALCEQYVNIDDIPSLCKILE